MIELGDLHVEALHDGAFSLDGGAMFGVIPRALWEKQMPPDAHNRVRLALRCLLVRAPGRVALVDTGMGNDWSPKAREMYAVDRDRTLLGELSARGLAAEDVTDVVLTHLHFDHAGGVVTRGKDGAPRLTFPRARHHVQRRNWEWAQKPSERDKGSFRAEDLALLAGTPLLHLVDGDVEIFPGLAVFVTEGHTVALQCVRIAGGGKKLLYPADLLPTAAHLKPAWGMSYDLEPLRLIEEKRALLAEAASDGAVVVFEHDPRVAACTVRREGGGFAIDREVML